MEELKWKITLRHIASMAQAVSIAATTFINCLELALSGFAQDPTTRVDHALPGGGGEWLEMVSKMGFLIGWESLVSTTGIELMMLEDAVISIRDLGRVAVQLVPSSGAGRGGGGGGGGGQGGAGGGAGGGAVGVVDIVDAVNAGQGGGWSTQVRRRTQSMSSRPLGTNCDATPVIVIVAIPDAQFALLPANIQVPFWNSKTSCQVQSYVQF
jgi:hypothetical protein